MFFSFYPFNAELVGFVFGLVRDVMNDVVNAFLEFVEVAEVYQLKTILD